MKYSLIISLLLSITISCAKKASKEEPDVRLETVKKNTLQLHDKLMVDMHKLNELKRELQQFVKSESDSLFNMDAKNAIRQLEIADSAMWDWMHGFDVTYNNKNDSMTSQYFKSKFYSLDSVKVLFDSSVVRSKTVLGNINN